MEEQYWMNPESPHYYKGYRFEIDDNEDFRWYDKRRKLRKLVTFHLNGQKNEEIYYNDKGITHRTDGFAYQQWDEEGNVLLQLKMINGKTDKEESVKNEPKVIKEYVVNHFPVIDYTVPTIKPDTIQIKINEIKPNKNILGKLFKLNF